MVAVVRSTLSAKAQRLGLENREDVEKEFIEAKSGWSKGTEYHCPSATRILVPFRGQEAHKTQAHPRAPGGTGTSCRLLGVPMGAPEGVSSLSLGCPRSPAGAV